jgi:hypothetical protein
VNSTYRWRPGLAVCSAYVLSLQVQPRTRITVPGLTSRVFFLKGRDFREPNPTTGWLRQISRLFSIIYIARNPNWLGPAISPGEILLEEYLKPLGVGQLEAAKRLGRFLKTWQQLWMRLQADWDLHQAMQREARQAS